MAVGTSSGGINFDHGLIILQFFGGVELGVTAVISVVISQGDGFIGGDTFAVDTAAFGGVPACSSDFE